MQTTPQWLEECLLEPVPPVDMKAVYIGESSPRIWMYWNDEEVTYKSVGCKPPNESVYVDIDKHFENET